MVVGTFINNVKVRETTICVFKWLYLLYINKFSVKTHVGIPGVAPLLDEMSWHKHLDSNKTYHALRLLILVLLEHCNGYVRTTFQSLYRLNKSILELHKYIVLVFHQCKRVTSKYSKAQHSPGGDPMHTPHHADTHHITRTPTSPRCSLGGDPMHKPHHREIVVLTYASSIKPYLFEITYRYIVYSYSITYDMQISLVSI